MVPDLAVSAGCKHIVTYNKRDFRGVETLGIESISPQKALDKIGAPL